MNERRLTFGSLFAGIGGIDLGLERAGWEVRWQVENDPYCQAVLGRHWPSIRRYGDVRSTHGIVAHSEGHLRGASRDEGSEASDGPCPGCLEPVDALAGGFPCQPVSTAGKRQAQADERWLWPEFARLVRDLRPRVVLVENVPGLLSASGGSAFGEVLGDLAALGYDAEWESLPAAAFGAPHLRYRVFLVAYAHDNRGHFGRLLLPSNQAKGRNRGVHADVSNAHIRVLRDEHRGSGGTSGEGASELGDDGEERALEDADRRGFIGPKVRTKQPGGAQTLGAGQDVADSISGGRREARRDLHGWKPDASRGGAVADATESGFLRETESEDDGTNREGGRRSNSSHGGQDVADTEGDRQSFPGRTWAGRERFENGSLSEAEIRNPDDSGFTEQQLAFAARSAWPYPERSSWWAVEPDVGRVAHGVSSRVDRLRTLGNAVVPQVAEWVGRRILETMKEGDVPRCVHGCAHRRRENSFSDPTPAGTCREWCGTCDPGAAYLKSKRVDLP